MSLDLDYQLSCKFSNGNRAAPTFAWTATETYHYTTRIGPGGSHPLDANEVKAQEQRELGPPMERGHP